MVQVIQEEPLRMGGPQTRSRLDHLIVATTVRMRSSSHFLQEYRIGKGSLVLDHTADRIRPGLHITAISSDEAIQKKGTTPQNGKEATAKTEMRSVY